MADPIVFFDLQRHRMDTDHLQPDRAKYHESWFKEDTVDFWRHRRMYETCAPVAAFYRKAKWLTVGDGRYGLDSVRLRRLFSINDILATDIAPFLLEKGKERGLFDSYSAENAERLTFADNSFDVVLCKESYHHFPRPAIALYEMIRVAKSAVILIEPLEAIKYRIDKREYVVSALKTIVWKLLGRPYIPGAVKIDAWAHGFEDSGNYVYALSVRETEKIVHGLDLGGMAWLGFNDHYINGCEFEQAVPGNKIFEEVKRAIQKLDELCTQFPNHNQYATIAIFKSSIDPGLMESMTEAGYRFMRKHNNPVIEKRRAGETQQVDEGLRQPM